MSDSEMGKEWLLRGAKGSPGKSVVRPHHCAIPNCHQSLVFFNPSDFVDTASLQEFSLCVCVCVWYVFDVCSVCMMCVVCGVCQYVCGGEVGNGMVCVRYVSMCVWCVCGMYVCV